MEPRSKRLAKAVRFLVAMSFGLLTIFDEVIRKPKQRA